MTEEYVEMAKQIFQATEDETGSLRSWWFTTERMTVYADCKDDIIYATSDITKKFVGQHIKNMADWLRQQGGFKFQEIGPPEKKR